MNRNFFLSFYNKAIKSPGCLSVLQHGVRYISVADGNRAFLNVNGPFVLLVLPVLLPVLAAGDPSVYTRIYTLFLIRFVVNCVLAMCSWSMTKNQALICFASHPCQAGAICRRCPSLESTSQHSTDTS